MKEQVFLFNPSAKTGGTNNLLTNLALAISEFSFVDLHIIDYKEGKCVSHLLKDEISFTHIIYEEGKRVDIKKGLFISILLHVKLIVRNIINLSSDTRILLWSTHPWDGRKILPSSNIFLKLPNLKLQKSFVSIFHFSYYNRMKAFFQMGMRNSGIVYMDNDNYIPNSIFFDSYEQKTIWPLTTSTPELKKDWEVNDDSELKITFLSRLVDFKFYPMLALLKQLNDMDLNIYIKIIGDGVFKGRLINELQKLDNLNFTFVGMVDVSELDQLLLDSHVIVGMATSALEGAKLGLPTIALPVSYKEIDHRLFRVKWLNELETFEIVNYSYRGSIDTYDSYLNSLRNILTNINMLKELGDKDKAKWNLDFSLNNLKLLFEQNLKANNFYYDSTLESNLNLDISSRFIENLKICISKK